MYGHAFRLGMIFVAALATGRAIAADPPAVAVASYVQTPAGGPMAKTVYYKNEDIIRTTPVPSVGAPGTHANATQTAITPRSELFTTSDANSTTPGSVAVKFLLDVESGPFAAIFADPQDALFTFSAVSTHAPVLSDGLFTQIFDSGTLSFTRASPLYTLDAFGNPVGDGLTNLLTISFTNAVLTASAGGLTVAFTADTPDSTIAYTSDFRTFTSAEEEAAFNFAISGADASAPVARAPVDPALTRVTGTRSLNSFRMSTTGIFAGPAVPEPQSWALFLIGFGAIGAMGRALPRRRADRPDRGLTIERYFVPNP